MEVEMSVDEASENEVIDNDIEGINPDKEKLVQSAEEVDPLNGDENNDEPIQETDERVTTDEQVKSDTTKTTPVKITVKDSTKTENKNKTTELPEKKNQKDIESEMSKGVKAEVSDNNCSIAKTELDRYTVTISRLPPSTTKKALEELIVWKLTEKGVYKFVNASSIQKPQVISHEAEVIAIAGMDAILSSGKKQLTVQFFCTKLVAEAIAGLDGIMYCGSKLKVFPVKETMFGKQNLHLKRLLVYPVTDQDLKGPVIKPLTDFSEKQFKIWFRARRGHSKQGVLDMTYKVTDNMMVQTLLSGELYGGIKPKTDDFNEYSGHYTLHLVERIERAWNSVAEDKTTEEQPVAVFVNNIPSGVCVEMLRFLYPSACSIQLPVNSQSVLLGYAIIEFPNLNEAKTVVKNNHTYPAHIGESYLEMYVVGHEGERDGKDAFGEFFTGKPEQTGSEKSQKRGISESKSSYPKRSRLDDDKLGSPPRRSSGNATKAPTNKVKTDLQVCYHFTSVEGCKLGSSCRFYHPDDDGDMFNVFIGNFGSNTSLQTLQGFLVEEMIKNGICLLGDTPIHSLKFYNKNAIAVFRSRTLALQAIKVLDKVKFLKLILDIKEGPKDIPSEAKSQRTEQKPIEDSKVEYNVHFGDVPKCRATEFLNFIKEEFRGRGLCGKDENPVKKLSFKSDRNFQFAVFSLSAHATAAVEKLSGAIFKGSPVTTKFHNADQGNATTQTLNNT